MIVYYSNNDSRDMHLLLTDIAFYLEKHFNATLVEKKYNTIKDNDIEIAIRSACYDRVIPKRKYL